VELQIEGHGLRDEPILLNVHFLLKVHLKKPGYDFTDSLRSLFEYTSLAAPTTLDLNQKLKALGNILAEGFGQSHEVIS
jgi:hypothetical protein